MLSGVHEIELISNFYILFDTCSASEDSTVDLYDANRIPIIMSKINKNEIVRMVYNNESIDEFTRFISSFLMNELNIKSSVERFTICSMKNLIINPSMI
jgi:hypothetical protein